MIYTLTVNPAIDYHMDLTAAGFQPGQINRSAKEEMFPGGKGLNVSVVLSELGTESVAWGYIAGKTGTMLETLAMEKGCRCDFIRLPEGETRINVKLDCEQETAVNGSGPQIEEAQADELLDKVRKLCAGDTVILSGNLQTGTVNLYEEICREAKDKEIRIVVDTEGENLRQTFPYHPYLIKPNEEELLALYKNSDRDTDGDKNSDISREKSPDKSMETMISLMKKCQEEGVRNVMVTLGGDGALLLTQKGDLYQAKIIGNSRPVSTVGAGDSTIAGFLAGMEKYRGDYEEALQLACAAGTATACQKWLAGAEQIRKAQQEIEVVKL